MEEIQELYGQLYNLCASKNIELNIQINMFPFVTGTCTATKKIFTKSINEVK